MDKTKITISKLTIWRFLSFAYLLFVWVAAFGHLHDYRFAVFSFSFVFVAWVLGFNSKKGVGK